MLACFVVAAFGLKPVFFAPPLFGSQLHVSAEKANVSWYCSSTFDDSLVWLSEVQLIPPFINCVAEYLLSEWDDETGRVRNATGRQVWSPDFGGDSSLRYIDEGVLGLHFIPDLVNVIDEFANHGHVIKKDMFGCPYDWRHGPLYIDDFYVRLKALIEEGYEANGKQRVSLFGYSEGGMVMHYFLTKKVDSAWKEKYIDRMVFTAPSFGGSISAVKIAWDHWSDKLPEIFKTEAIDTWVRNIPTLAAHAPNHFLLPDTPAVIGPNGEKYYAKDVQQLLYDHEKVTGSGRKMAEAAKEVYMSDIPHPGVDTYMLLNSGQKTTVTLDFADGWDKPYKEIKSEGDDTILADTLRSIVKKWGDQGKSVVFHDFNMSGSDWTHRMMITAPEYTAMIYDIMTADDWKVPGVHYVNGTTLKDWDKIRKLKQ